MKKLSQAIVLASAMTAGLAATQAAHAEISASFDVASSYLWRGQNLSAGKAGAIEKKTTTVEVDGADQEVKYTDATDGTGQGTAVVSGSIDYTNESGLYAGVWTSSGDGSAGTETDLYVGFAGEAGSIGYDIGYVTYLYTETANDEIDDLAEFYLGLSYDVVGVTMYKSSDSDVDGMYAVLGADIPDTPFSVALGAAIDTGNAYTHLDATYAYNDQVAFTVSKIVDEEVEDAYDKSTRYVISYSMPIE